MASGQSPAPRRTGDARGTRVLREQVESLWDAALGNLGAIAGAQPVSTSHPRMPATGSDPGVDDLSEGAAP